jgi:thymidylate synthase (FAD)
MTEIGANTSTMSATDQLLSDVGIEVSKISARLIGITESRIEEADTPEELLVYVARVSNPNNQANMATKDKLLKYCQDKHHWSPFEMVDVILEIKCPREIAHQILRHRSANFQEFSQRYAVVLDPPFYRSARLQHATNRQSSIESTDRGLNDWWLFGQQQVWDLAVQVYKSALEAGIAKEVARAVLPEGMTMTTLYMKAPIRTWIHYCQIRLDVSTQKEHRDVALACWECLHKEFPAIDFGDPSEA